jgi:hypothetical protein
VEDDDVPVAGWHARTRGEEGGQIGGVDGGETHQRRFAGRIAKAAQSIHGFRQGILLAADVGHEPAATDFAAGFHPS